MNRSPRKAAGVFAVLLALTAGCGKPVEPVATTIPVMSEPRKATADADLRAFLDQAWQRELRDNPSLATYLGDRRYDDRWEDLRPEAVEARRAGDRDLLGQLQAIDRENLSAAAQLNHDLFRRYLEDRIEGQAFDQELMPMSQLEGLQLSAQLLDFVPFAEQKDYENWLARLQGFGDLVDQTIALMRRGIAEQRLRPRIVMRRVLPQVAAQVVPRAQDSPFYAPFLHYPDAVAPDVGTQLALAGQAAITDVVVPAFRRLQAFLESEYLPACPENVFGLAGMPGSEPYYGWLIRHYTGTTLSPEEIHQIGLREVERLDRDLGDLMRKAGHHGSATAFAEKLSADPRYRHTDRARLLEAYRAVAKRIDPELPRLFGQLPRTPYGVREIPDFAAVSAPAAYYYPPAADGSRAGYFYANTLRPETRPGWMMEALVSHEAVPGHHLQIALANELQDLPEFRRFGLELTAFVEGWGLYAESLGGELGLYADAGSRFGQLTAEIWRAVRLVVDTGLHAKGWSRKMAREYFAEHAPRPAAEIEVEVDRYIASPGQALAYKIGELRFQDLRKRAHEKLGDRFDVRAFHDLVLGSGPLPLDLLEQQVDRWIETRRPDGEPDS